MANPNRQQQTVNPSQDERTEDQGDVATMQSMGMAPPTQRQEIEVDPVQPQQGARRPGQPPSVIIRVNEDIEDMTWFADGKAERYAFEAGNRYEVPVYIAQELENLGKIWH